MYSLSDRVLSILPTAQHVRRLFQDFGFVPLCRLGSAEWWTRGPKLIGLAWDGDTPGAVPATSTSHAFLVAGPGDGGDVAVHLSLD